MSCEPSRNGSMGLVDLVSGLSDCWGNGELEGTNVKIWGPWWVHNLSAVIRLPILNDMGMGQNPGT